MTAWIVNQRTGGRTGPFSTYVEAAEFRRKVLRPRLAPDAPCPFAIRTEEAEQLSLTAVCVIPGCDTPVVEWGDVCEGCVKSFGPMLRPGGVPLTEYEIRERDREVRAGYALQQMEA